MEKGFNKNFEYLLENSDDPLWGSGEGNDPAGLPSLTLAYMGDVVFELMVRRHYLDKGVLKPGRLHKLTVGQVCASRQACLARQIQDFLSEDELLVYKRGRNAKSSHHAPNMSVTDYRRATGLEALIGYLYLCGRQDRLQWLIQELFKDEEKQQ